MPTNQEVPKMIYRIRIERDNQLQEGGYKWEEVYEQTVENLDVPALVIIINQRQKDDKP